MPNYDDFGEGADRNEILLDIAVRLATFDEGFAHILEQRATDQNLEGTAPPRVDDRPRRTLASGMH